MATVITNLLSAIPYIGTHLVELAWGGFSVDNPTLNRFFSLHYLLPFILAALVIGHLIALHTDGSNNPLGISSKGDKIPFHPYFTFKDLAGVFAFLFILSLVVFFYPNSMGHSDNYIPANPMVTPTSIVPEWYLLPFYAILRSIPSKLGGVLAMFGSLLILLVLPYVDYSRIRGNIFKPISKLIFWLFVFNFLLLLWLGSQHVEEPFILLGQISTLFYFLYFPLIFIISILENTLIDVALDN